MYSTSHVTSFQPIPFSLLPHDTHPVPCGGRACIFSLGYDVFLWDGMHQEAHFLYLKYIFSKITHYTYLFTW